MPASRLDGDSRDLHSFCQTHSSAVQGCGRESFHHHHEELLCTKEQELRAWKLQFLFAKCVLRLQPTIRGGKQKKLRRNESLRTGLLKRLKRWNAGDVDVLWLESCKMYAGSVRQAVTNSLANNIRRATKRTLGMAKLCLLCFLSALVPSQSKR